MKEIELIVKIPEEIRLALINNIQLSMDQQSFMDSCIKQAIINGVKLPKGHGKLKDVDHYVKMRWEHPDYSLMDDELTIIEADTEV